MPHRSSLGPLRAWREEILNRLATLELREDAEGERVQLLSELDEVRRSLELLTPPRPLRMRLRLVQGCQMSWEMMVGDARVRHCGACDREVYDLRAMDPDEIEAFLAARREKLPCMRVHIRPDGRYQDGPCAPAARRRLTRATATAASLGLVGIISLLSAETSAVDDAVRARLPVPATFDAEAFLEAPETFEWSEPEGPMAIGLFALPEPYADSIVALEASLWERIHPTRGGVIGLRVTISTEGWVTAEVDEVRGPLAEDARRAVREARRLRATFRPEEPITTFWYHDFRADPEARRTSRGSRDR